MKKFAEYSQVYDTRTAIMEVLALRLAQQEQLEEEIAVGNKVSGTIDSGTAEGRGLSRSQRILKRTEEVLSRIGLERKQEVGLIHYLKGAAVGVSEMFFAALMGDKEKIKEVMGRVTKGKMLDFFMKIDVLTLHLLSAPLHMLDAVTGWDLHASIRNAAMQGKKAVVSTFEDAIEFIEDKIEHIHLPEWEKARLKSEINDVKLALGTLMGH